MKKRLFVVLAVLALTVCLLPMVVGAEATTCDHVGTGITIKGIGNMSMGVDVHLEYCAECDELLQQVACTFDESDCTATPNCSACGHVRNYGIKAAHNYEGATCTERGRCTNGNCLQTCDPMGHDQNSPAATCTSEQTCLRCQAKMADKLPHKRENGYQTGIGVPVHQHGYYCNMCKEMQLEDHTETTPANCKDRAFCAVCHMSYGTTNPNVHTGNVVTDEAVPHTCTEDGLTEGSHCGDCGETIVAQEVDPAAHTDVVIDEAVPHTCTQDGLTEGSHCEDCGVTVIAQEVDPAAHTPGPAATCEEDQICTVCEDVLKKAIGHDWDDGVVTKPATGFATGIKLYTCKNDPSHTYEKATPVLYIPDDPNLDRVPRTGNAFVEWLYALIAG